MRLDFFFLNDIRNLNECRATQHTDTELNLWLWLWQQSQMRFAVRCFKVLPGFSDSNKKNNAASNMQLHFKCKENPSEFLCVCALLVAVKCPGGWCSRSLMDRCNGTSQERRVEGPSGSHLSWLPTRW